MKKITPSNKTKQKQRSERNARIIRLVIAIALALFLWVYINGNSIDLISQDVENIPVKVTGIEQLTGRGLAVEGNNKYYVNIRLRGSQQNLRAVDTSAIKASVDLSDFHSAGTVSPEVVIQGVPNNVILDARRPENLTFTIVGLSEKTRRVHVNVNGSPGNGLSVLSVTTSGKVSAIGSTTSIGKIHRLVATVDVSGITSDTDAYTHVIAYDDKGKPIRAVRCQPDRVLTHVKIGTTKKVKVNTPTTTGSPAEGYKVSRISISPKTVTIGGKPSVLNSISSVSTTGTLKVTDENESVTKRFALDLPDGIMVLESSSKVTVTADIEPED